MHRPKAHISRHGAADTISGAMPTAASQFQPSARPKAATVNPATARTRRSRIQDRTASSGNDAVGQHDAVAGTGAPPGVLVADVDAIVVLSKLSMIVVLVLSDPCQDREGVEQPIGKARQLTCQDGDSHCGDDHACAEL